MKEKLAKLIKGVTLALLYIMTYTIFQAVYMCIAALVLHYSGGDIWDVNNHSGIVLIFSAISSLLVYLAIYYLRKTGLNKVICTKHLSLINVIAAFILAIGFRLLTGVYMLWAENTAVFKETIETLENAYDFTTMKSVDILLLAACVVFLAPVFEEILLRGMVLKELESCMPVWLAIFLQGVLFGIMHGNIVQFVFTTIIGIVLGIVYHKTKNLSMTIFVHLFFNCSAVLEVTEKSTLPVTVAVGVLMVVVSMVMIFYTHRKDNYTVCD